MKQALWFIAGMVALSLVSSDVWTQGADVFARRLFVDSTASDAVDIAGGIDISGDLDVRSIDVESTSPTALDVAGGIVLGIDLSAEDGGVPEAGILFVNAATCPSPLVAFTIPFDSMGLLACLYATSDAAILGSALLGTSRLQ